MKQTDDVAAWRRAGRVLGEISRDDALATAVLRCRDPQADWVRAAHKRGVLEALCLGSFRLVNPYNPSLPWPSVVFLVREGSSRARLCAYLDEDGAWQAMYEGETPLPDGSRGVHVAWEQYCGDPDGPPGVLNGDAARGVMPADPPAVVAPARRRADAGGTPRPRPKRRPRSTRSLPGSSSSREEMLLRLLDRVLGALGS